MKLLLNFLFIALIISCDKSAISNPDNFFVDAENAFEKGDYTSAVENFLIEIDKDIDETALDARVGLAWSYLRLNDFENTKIALQNLKAYDSQNKDYDAIYVLLEYVEQDYSSVETHAFSLFSIDIAYLGNPDNVIPDLSYELFLDDDIDYRDIALVYAFSLYKEKRFEDAMTIIQGFLDFRFQDAGNLSIEFAVLRKLEELSN